MTPPIVVWHVTGDPPVTLGGRGGVLHGHAATWWQCMAPKSATDIVDDDVANALRGAAAMATLHGSLGTARELTAITEAWGHQITATVTSGEAAS